MSKLAKALTAAAGNAGEEIEWNLDYLVSDPFSWSLTSLTDQTNFSVGSQETLPWGLFFKPDGTKMYVCGSTGDDVNEYDLGTAWAVGTAVYSQNFSVSSQTSFPTGVWFKSDGTKMYVLGLSGTASIYEYDLSTAWDVSSASYSQSASVSVRAPSPYGFYFSPDGTYCFVSADGANDDVVTYSLSTAWDISTLSYVRKYDIPVAQGNQPRGIFFKEDGTRMFLCNSDPETIQRFDLSTAWNTNTASFVNEAASPYTDPTGLFFKSDGTKLYVMTQLTDLITEFSTDPFYVGDQEATPYGGTFSTDGTKFYVIGGNGDEVNQWDFDTAWDFSTASYTQAFSVSSQDSTPHDLFFKPDGTKMYVVGLTNNSVYEYALSSAWDVSSASYTSTFSVATEDTLPQGLFFKSDGTKMYVCGNINDGVYEYDLSTAWDISSASYSQTLSVTANVGNPSSLFFRDDGLRMFVAGASDVNQYELTTAWDISTATFSKFYNNTELTRGITFKDDGSQMWVTSSTNDSIYQYKFEA